MIKIGNRRPILEPSRENIKSGFLCRFFLNQRFLVVVGLLFLLVIIFPLLKTHNQRRLVEQEIIDIQNQISEFENQNQRLSELLVYLQSEQSLEEQARLSLNMKKAGEEVVVIENKNIAHDNQTQDEDNARQSNVVKWWRYFFN